MEKINALFFVIFISYIWFDTEAFVEYSSLLKLKFTKYKEYIEFKSKCAMDYHNFLLSFHNNFLVRMITCPICFITVISFILLCFIGYLDFLGTIVVFSWMGYFGLRKILKNLMKEDE